MEPVEFELRQALSRRTPPADFTERILGEIRAEPRHRWKGWRWAAIGTMAASLSLGVFAWKERSDRQALVADQQAEDILLALQSAGGKLNLARDAVLRSGTRGSQR